MKSLTKQKAKAESTSLNQRPITSLLDTDERIKVLASIILKRIIYNKQLLNKT